MDYSNIKKKMRGKTNEERLRALVKDFNFTTMGNAILRERILKITELTRKGIAENPEAYANPIIDANSYLQFCDMVEAYLSFDDAHKLSDV